MRYTMLVVCMLVACLLAGGWIWQGDLAATADEPEPRVGDSLGKQLFVPESGLIEVISSIGSLNIEIDIEDVENVFALYEKLEALDLDLDRDRASIESWEFLSQIEAKQVPEGRLSIREGDRRVEVEVPKFDKWRTQHFAFEPRYQALWETVNEISSKTVTGPRSVATIYEWIGGGQISHDYSADRRRSAPDSLSLFSRNANYLIHKGAPLDAPRGELFVVVHQRGKSLVWVDRKSDAIFGRVVTTHQGEVRSFTLHLGLRPIESPRPHQQPQWTLTFDRRPTYWSVRAYQIRDVQWEIPLPIDTFQVPLRGNFNYVTPGAGIRVPFVFVGDIIPFTPSEVLAMDHKARKERP